MKKTITIRGGLILMMTLFLCEAAFLQPIKDGLPQITDKYAITGATVITAPGQKIENATILIEDGLIKYVGNSTRIDGDAYMVKADSMYIYAGFIDALSHAGLTKPKKGDQERAVDPGNPTNERAGIQPENSIEELLSPKESSVSDLRKLGFTISHVVPEGRMLPGQGSIVLLSGKSADEMILKKDISTFSQLRGASGVYPGTVIGVMAKFRELYRNAENAAMHQKTFNLGGGVERPAYDRSTLALVPVIEKKQPIYFHANDLKSLHRVLALQKELGFKLVASDVKQSWGIENKLNDANASVIVSLDLPEVKDAAKKKDEKKDDEKEDEDPDEPTFLEKEKEMLEQRKAESATRHLQHAGSLAKSGFPISFSTMSVKSKDIFSNLRKMVENGLTEDQALAGLTTNPASLLGISDYTGSVSNGKMANLVIMNKPFLDEKAQVRYVFVDGDMYEFEVKEEKKKEKKDGDEPVGDAASIAGTWSFSVETPGGNQTGYFKLEESDDGWSGVIGSDGDDDEDELSNISFDEGKLTFNFVTDMDGNAITIEVDLDVDGTDYEGEVSVGPMGAFPITGSKRSPNK
jgi:imidazolonepropionase-like amidohydrolase